MIEIAKFLRGAVCSVAVCIAGAIFAFGGTAATVNLPTPSAGYIIDDDVPDVTARVARISFLSGEAQVRRAGSDDWERATLNLPIVEGDEIATTDGRVEIQFDNVTHLRLAENSFLKIVTLKKEGIATSLSIGTGIVRITTFDRDRTFFEVDLPRTTMAILHSGNYRIDAGAEGDTEIRVSANNDGEARVYSDEAGFTLKNGRTARVFIDGPNAGEWQIENVSDSPDDIAQWSDDRDRLIAKQLSDAYYDRYYDRDIYGADDLNGYGEWVYTRNYGYVWRPFSSAISSYADWSPYRYGHWRWVPPYGWTWVNDEPWGWATYHHGRWFYDSGFWYWSPYGYIRSSHSWWFPALVSINIFNNNVCWYPLGYHHRYRRYNGHHGGYYGGQNNNNNPPVQTGGIKVIPPTREPVKGVPPAGTGGIKTPRTGKVPPNAVVSMAVADFGMTTKTIKPAPTDVANTILSKEPGDTDPVMLPTVATRKLSRDIIIDKPVTAVRAGTAKVGAAPRSSGVSLDNELRTKRVFGGRKPADSDGDTGGVSSTPGETGGVRTPTQVREPRKTGAVVREPVRHAPITSPPPPVNDDESVSHPIKVAPKRTPPDPVRSDPVPVRQPPRIDPVRATPSAPVRSEPSKAPVKPSPPVKSEPKPESKPSKTDVD